MSEQITIKIECGVKQGSNVEVSSRWTVWNQDVTDTEFAFNVTLLALAALREAREKSN